MELIGVQHHTNHTTRTVFLCGIIMEYTVSKSILVVMIIIWVSVVMYQKDTAFLGVRSEKSTIAILMT